MQRYQLYSFLYLIESYYTLFNYSYSFGTALELSFLYMYLLKPHYPFFQTNTDFKINFLFSLSNIDNKLTDHILYGNKLDINSYHRSLDNHLLHKGKRNNRLKNHLPAHQQYTSFHLPLPYSIDGLDSEHFHLHVHNIVIGKPLILSLAFPPLHTVRATFTAHGVPAITSYSNEIIYQNFTEFFILFFFKFYLYTYIIIILELSL